MSLRRHTISLGLVAVLVSGCLDLALLDDLIPTDAGAKETASAAARPAPDPSDASPPDLVRQTCGAGARVDAALCIIEGPISASIRFRTDEPADIVPGQPALGVAVLSPPWSEDHWLVAFGPNAFPGELALRILDVNGNSQTIRVLLRATEGPPVVITEILADPAGPEPAQEFVEVLNLGEGFIDLSGWRIVDDGPGQGDTLPAGSLLAPGAAALIVPSGFDPTDTAGPAPAPDTPLFRVDASIGANGLKNSGPESVTLFDGEGRWVSGYAGAVTPKPGLSIQRRHPALPPGDPAAYDAEPSPPTPGTVPWP